MTPRARDVKVEWERIERNLPHVDLESLGRDLRALVGAPLEEAAGLARDGMQVLAEGGTPSPEQVQAIELAIRQLRPVPLVNRGVIEPLGPPASDRFTAWDGFRSAVEPSLGSIGVVCRVDLDTGEEQRMATGFVIATRVLATNHHVLSAITLSTDQLVPGQAVIRFGGEADGDEPEPVSIEAVVAVHPTLDAVLLRLAPEAAGRAPLRCDRGPVRVGDEVATIGYPVRDPLASALQTLMLGKHPGVKRAAPGEVRRVARTALDHDCSTMQGNSGSPLLRQTDGVLVGIHAEGWYGARNGAVPMTALAAWVDEAVA